MAKGHPYAFNMGHGIIIPFKDYKEAAAALMERNMPEVLTGHQTKAVFVPETHLPKMPRVTDLEQFEERKKRFTDGALAFLGMKPGREDVTNTIGDVTENELTEALKKFYDQNSGKKVVVLQGCVLRTLRKGKGGIQENDVVIVDYERKVVICIESKASLNRTTGHKAVRQMLELKLLLEE